MEFAFEIETLLKAVDGDFQPPLSSSVNLAEYARKLCSKATIFSVHENGQLIALMAVYSNDLVSKIAYGPMFAVAHSHRACGLGTNLIKTTIDYLKKKGFKTFKLEVYKTNPRAITLYKRLRFVVVTETDKSVFVEINLSS